MDNVFAMREYNYQQAQIVQALITAMGMFAEVLKEPGKYSREDFESIIEEYGIHHNAIIGGWNEVLKYQ